MKTTILSALLFICSIVLAQEPKNNSADKTIVKNNKPLKLNSIGYGFGFFSTTQNDGGLSGIIELGLIANKNLFLVNYLSGSTFTILGPAGIEITELNLQIGREHKVTNWFSIQGFAGLGYINQELQSYSSKAVPFTSASVPLRLKLVCYTGKHFALVSNSNYNINATSSVFSSNLTFQHIF